MDYIDDEFFETDPIDESLALTISFDTLGVFTISYSYAAEAVSAYFEEITRGRPAPIVRTREFRKICLEQACVSGVDDTFAVITIHDMQKAWRRLPQVVQVARVVHRGPSKVLRIVGDYGCGFEVTFGLASVEKMVCESRESLNNTFYVNQESGLEIDFYNPFGVRESSTRWVWPGCPDM